MSLPHKDIADLEFLTQVTKGAKTLVLASSATPKIKKRSIALMMVKKLIPGMKPSMPSFRWPPDGEPQRVDFDFALNQFAAAKQNGVQQVVYCGSMGGTQADNRLNLIGDGNILVRSTSVGGAEAAKTDTPLSTRCGSGGRRWRSCRAASLTPSCTQVRRSPTVGQHSPVCA